MRNLSGVDLEILHSVLTIFAEFLESLFFLLVSAVDVGQV